MKSNNSVFWWSIFAVYFILFVLEIVNVFVPFWTVAKDSALFAFSSSTVIYWLTEILTIVVACFLIKAYPNNRSLRVAGIGWIIVIILYLIYSFLFSYIYYLKNIEIISLDAYSKFAMNLSNSQTSVYLLNYAIILLLAYSASTPTIKKLLHWIVGILLFQRFFIYILNHIHSYLPDNWYKFYWNNHLYLIFIVLLSTLWLVIFASLAQKQSFLDEEITPVPTDRSLGKMIFLGILTLGAYPLYIYTALSMEINREAKADGKHTMNYLLVTFVFSWLTLFIAPLVWMHRICNRMHDALNAQGSNYAFSARDFWLWGILGSLIIVGPFVFISKMMKASNILAGAYNNQLTPQTV